MYYVILLVVLIISLFLLRSRETFGNIEKKYDEISSYNKFSYDNPSTILEEQSWKPVGVGTTIDENESKENESKENESKQLSLEDIKNYFFSLKTDNKTDKTTPNNCIGNWDKSWSSCSKECGGGVQKKFFKILQNADAGGIPCSYKNGDSIDQSCNMLECPINCQGSWSGWGECDKKCKLPNEEYGKSSREYTISIEGKHGYNNNKFLKAISCDFSNGTVEYKSCNSEPCAVDCEGSYKPFGQCSNWCDGGVQESVYEIAIYPKSGYFNGIAVEGKKCPNNKIRECNTNAVCPK
tara:strand:- start:3601 stop:4485 length:885 start_codon:yes stop_codon:yes gene_type:complete